MHSEYAHTEIQIENTHNARKHCNDSRTHKKTKPVESLIDIHATQKNLPSSNLLTDIYEQTNKITHKNKKKRNQAIFSWMGNYTCSSSMGSYTTYINPKS